MTKDIMLKIRGIQIPPEGMGACEGPVEILTSGNFFERDGRCYIQYEEVEEESGEVIHSLIKTDGRTLEVARRGAADVHMVFEKGKKNVSYYNTPFGSLVIGILAARVDMRRTRNSLTIETDYVLEMNETFAADCAISIYVQSRESEEE